MLFGVVTSPSFASKDLEQAGGIEFRFDLFPPFSLEELKSLLNPLPLKKLFSLRPVRQGGMFKETEEARWERLHQLCLLNPDYVDLEYDVPLSVWKKFSKTFPNIQWVCSYHDFSKRGLYDFSQIFDSMRNPYASIYKIAVTPLSAVQALELFDFIKTHQTKKTRLIGISMGEKGQFARPLGPIAEHLIDYALVTHATAPGQYTLDAMALRYRYAELNHHTAIYGLIGDPVVQSQGDRWHNERFGEQRRNAVYVKIPLPLAELNAFMHAARRVPFKGLSVTMPLKEAVVPYLDRLAPSAAAIQAVNTVVIEEGVWVGHNTDGTGALNAFESVLSVQNRRILIVGAGGTARAIAYTATKRGALVTVLNRSLEKALVLSRQFQCRGGDFSFFPTLVREGYDGIINTTPVGECILPEWILPNKVAMDVVYTPKETPFLQKAAAKGCRLVYGEAMFIAQALEQQRLWNGNT